MEVSDLIRVNRKEVNSFYKISKWKKKAVPFFKIKFLRKKEQKVKIPSPKKILFFLQKLITKNEVLLVIILYKNLKLVQIK
jgi:hypothetical protein